MTRHTTTTSDTDLQKIFHCRLHTLFSLYPNLVRPGRGCNSDFRKKFNLHYTTATPILDGKALPGLSLSTKIAHEFGCSLEWLIGFDKSAKESESICIKLFDQAGEISIPRQYVKHVTDSSNLLAARSPASAKQEDLVIIEPKTTLEDGVIHYCFNPRKNIGGLFKVLKLGDGEFELENQIGGFKRRIKNYNTLIGQTEALTSFTIIGPVIAQIYWDLG